MIAKTHRIVLYTKPGCHLCEIAHELLLELRREFDLTIESLDITTDRALLKEYFEKIPVLVIDDHTTLCAPIRAEDVRATLGREEE